MSRCIPFSQASRAHRVCSQGSRPDRGVLAEKCRGPSSGAQCRASPRRHALAVALLLALAPLAASAATILVRSPDDTDPNGPSCTLRQAILSMNERAPHGWCIADGAPFGTDDEIAFTIMGLTGGATPGTITLADSADTSGNVGGTLVVSAANLTIDGLMWRGDGPGQYPGGVTIARPATATQLFGILADTAPAGSSLTLKGLTIRNGNMDLAAAGTCGSGDGEKSGGGICIQRADLTLIGSTVKDNRAHFSGGGIQSGSGALTLTDSTISGNWARGAGGGIFSSSGVVTLTRSSIDGNLASVQGAGLYAAAGTVSVIDSTISFNTAASKYGGHGGGIVSRNGALSLTNSTVAGNSSVNSGGGITSRGSTLILNHVTVTNNDSDEGIGGIDGTTATIVNSIVSGNTSGLFPDDISLTGGWTGSDNLIGPDASASLHLGPLQPNGGATSTMQPEAGSAAIDGVLGVSCAATDQRGLPRPQGPRCDIGAVEVHQDVVFTVTAAVADSHGTITPASQPVVSGNGASFTVVPDPGFAVASVLGDTCTVTQRGARTWTSDAITQDCAVVATFADYPSRCTGANRTSLAFFDDFPGDALDPDRWTSHANGGTVAVADHSVELAGSPFPFVTAVGQPIPPSGAFSVRWSATYGGQRPYGTGTLALAQTLPANGAPSWQSVAGAWQDGSSYRVQVRTDAATVQNAYVDAAPIPVPHEVEYCWLPDTVEVYVDGMLAMRQVRDASVARPTTLWSGNPINNGGDWQDFKLHYVEVRALNDGLFKDGFDD